MLRTLLLLIVSAVAIAAQPADAASINQVQVHVVTGHEELSGGSVVELRIYEAGRSMRHFPLTHGTAWPRDSTLIIPLTLTEPLDPRNVVRFALYYRAASPLAPPWEVVAADVEMIRDESPPERLLNVTLSGVIANQGELASEERDAASLACMTDEDCDNHKKCDGHERCAPAAAGADARGCVRGEPLACPVNQVCSEDRGCVGLDASAAH